MPVAPTNNVFAATAAAPRSRRHLATGAYADDPRWQLVQRVIASRSLGKSELLASFLVYVCDRQLRGLESEITEQQIGVSVFGRPGGYNSNEDNIVRNYARTLRKRLADYFMREGTKEQLTLCIPLGGYVPVFADRPMPGEEDQARKGYMAGVDSFARTHAEERASTPEGSTPSTTLKPHGPAAHRTMMAGLSRPPVRFVMWSTLLAVVACAAGFLAGDRSTHSPLLQYRAGRSNRLLWSQLFVQDRDTFIVPADGGLVMVQSFTKEQASLSDYISGSYRSDAEIDRGLRALLQTAHAEDQAQLVHKVSVLAGRRYTSVADLSLTAKLARLPVVIPERLVIRFARDIRMDDLRMGNAILLGSSDANPWVSLFETQLNFQFKPGLQFGGSGRILNRHPLPGEQPEYASITGDVSNATYGVICYVPNLDNTGHVLLVEGVNMAGTQAAGEFLLQAERMRPLLDRALDGNNSLRSFEILLKTTNIASNASSAQVISERVH